MPSGARGHRTVVRSLLSFGRWDGLLLRSDGKCLCNESGEHCSRGHLALQSCATCMPMTLFCRSKQSTCLRDPLITVPSFKTLALASEFGIPQIQLLRCEDDVAFYRRSILELPPPLYATPGRRRAAFHCNARTEAAPVIIIFLILFPFHAQQKQNRTDRQKGQ